MVRLSSILALALSLALTSGCSSMLGLMGPAADAHKEPVAIDESRDDPAPPPSSEATTPGRVLTAAGSELTGQTPLHPPMLVDISLSAPAPHRIQVFEMGEKRSFTAECVAECMLQLAASRYAFAVGNWSTLGELDIPAAEHRSVRLDLNSREPLRIAGWSMVGASIAGMAVFTGASAALEVDDPAVYLPTTLSLFAVLVVGVVLGLLPDEVRASLEF